MYSFLSIGWGLIADIDIESERLRSIGDQRFTIWSLARLVGRSMEISLELSSFTKQQSQDYAHIEAEFRTALLLVTGRLGMGLCCDAAPVKMKQSTLSALQMASAATSGVRVTRRT
jgi:hypothetical protein